MKKIMTLVMFMSLAVSLSSCMDCLILALFARMYNMDLGIGLLCLAYEDDATADLITNMDDAAHGEDPVLPSARGQNVKTPLPPAQIEDKQTSSERGADSQQEERGSSFNDIITSPTFTLGPSLSWLGGDKEDAEKFPARAGFQLGASWQVPLTDRLNFEPGLGYAKRGVGYESEESGYVEPGDGPGGSYSYSYGQKKKLHYLELPLSVGYNIGNGLDVYGGPQVAFLLGAKVVNESNGETTSTEKGTSGFNKVDVGLAAGVRYHLPNTFFNVSLGYYHGLSNLSSGSEYGGYGYDEPKYFTRAARLGLQYNFPAARSNARSGSAKKNSLKSWVSK
jgi:hypothetical protein